MYAACDHLVRLYESGDVLKVVALGPADAAGRRHPVYRRLPAGRLALAVRGGARVGGLGQRARPRCLRGRQPGRQASRRARPPALRHLVGARAAPRLRAARPGRVRARRAHAAADRRCRRAASRTVGGRAHLDRPEQVPPALEAGHAVLGFGAAAGRPAAPGRRQPCARAPLPRRSGRGRRVAAGPCSRLAQLQGRGRRAPGAGGRGSGAPPGGVAAVAASGPFAPLLGSSRPSPISPPPTAPRLYGGSVRARGPRCLFWPATSSATAAVGADLMVVVQLERACRPIRRRRLPPTGHEARSGRLPPRGSRLLRGAHGSARGRAGRVASPRSRRPRRCTPTRHAAPGQGRGPAGPRSSAPVPALRGSGGRAAAGLFPASFARR